MPMIASSETLVSQNPAKFKMAQPTKLLTRINGEPPMNAGKGRRRNPVITAIYNELVSERNVWFHVNIPITDKKQLASIRTSLFARAAKDNLSTATSSVFNEETKMYDLWVMLTA